MIGEGVAYDDIFDEEQIDYVEKSSRRLTGQSIIHRSLQKKDVPLKTWLEGPPLKVSTTLSYECSSPGKSKRKRYKRERVRRTGKPPPRYRHKRRTDT